MTTTRVPETLRLPASRHPVPTRTRLRTRRLPLFAYVAVLLLLPVAVIAGARVAGWWVTTGHSVPATALGAGAAADQPTGGSSQPGQDTAAVTITNPSDIKGSMTVQQILDAFPATTAADIYQLFGVPGDTPTSTPLKQLVQAGNGYEVSDLRGWLETR